MAVLLLVLVGAEVRRRSHRTPPVVAGLVQLGEGRAVELRPDTKDFVLQLELVNKNPSPAQVRAEPVPARPGFDRLVVAVLPGRFDSTAPAGDALAEAARTAVTLGPGEPAQLTVAGRIVCGAPMGSLDEVSILVDDEKTKVAIPPSEGHGWAEEVNREACA